MTNHKKIYKVILELVEVGAMTRAELISLAVASLLGGETKDGATLGKETEARGMVGAVLNEMLDSGVLGKEGDRCYLVSSKPVALRVESCEKEMLSLLRVKPMTKPELRQALVRHFGTDKTASTHDDNILYSLIGQVTKRLINFGVIELVDSKYQVAPEKRANIEDISDMLALKNDFMTRLHSKGGEFFEHFILTLLSKHLAKSGKTINECYVTGGSDDMGIDGVIKTTDTLGFREVLMIQAKNRLEMTSETTVRGFYGAVCAAQGSRGVFATTSDFHPSAAKFLENIDNCVGVNADRIFAMACDCLYGIKRRDGKYYLDTKIL